MIYESLVNFVSTKYKGRFDLIDESKKLPSTSIMKEGRVKK